MIEEKIICSLLAAFHEPKNRVENLRAVLAESDLDQQLIFNCCFMLLSIAGQSANAAAEKWINLNPGQSLPTEMALTQIGGVFFSGTEVLEMTRDIIAAFPEAGKTLEPAPLKN